MLRAAAPRRHTGQPDAVLYDVEQLAVAQVLCIRPPHVRSWRIHVFSHLGFAAAVIGMAGSAVIGPMRSRVRYNFRRIAGRVYLLSCAGWHGHRARTARGPSLQGARLLTGAETMRTHQEYAAAKDDDGD